MRLLGTEFEKIDFKFIKDQLVDVGVAENYRLEYKGRGFLNRIKTPDELKKDKWNLAKKICGLANRLYLKFECSLFY